MEFTKREQQMLRYVERHGTRPHLLVVSLIAILLGAIIGMALAIKGVFNNSDIFYLMFICALVVLLCAIANFRICTSIIQKYQKKLTELGVK